ncbi:hypothetical protein ACVWYH_003098 [Bradyrhizobium sp. GM24.11]
MPGSYKINYARRGAPVRMSDGWLGKIEGESGHTVVCIKNGEVPNDDLRGYRVFNRQVVTMKVRGKSLVRLVKNSTLDANGDIFVHLVEDRSAVDAFLLRAKIRRSWNDAPVH